MKKWAGFLAGVIGVLSFSSVSQDASAAPSRVKPAACVTVALSKGMRGSPQVAALQQRLATWGFKPGPVDGWFGNKTKAAVVRWEAANKWSSNGIADVSEMSSVGLLCPPITQSFPAPPTANSGANPVSLDIPSLGMRRSIVLNGSQSTIDACNGASLVWSTGGYASMWLAAHRTSCGNSGFGGVQNLRAGDKVNITLADGTVRTFTVNSVTTINRVAPGVSFESVYKNFPLVLQTTKSGTIVYIVYAS
mgnify:CR=1 FL=1